MRFMNSSGIQSGSAEQRAQFRVEVVTYRSEHTIRATMERFHVGKSFICKWYKRFMDGDRTLCDKSRRPIHCEKQYSDAARDAFRTALIADNQGKHKRNKLMKSVYQCGDLLEGRSYSSIKRLAAELIGRQRRRSNPKAKKKIRTGTTNQKPEEVGALVQIDMKCVPACCIIQKRDDEEQRKQLIIEEAREYEEHRLNEYDNDKKHFPNLKIIDYMRNECILDCNKFVDDVKREALLPLKPLKLYQYTAVDAKSRWSFRWLFSEKSELASLRFIIELITHAPFPICCVQTDNGAEFASSYLNGHEHHITQFGQFLEAYHIGHILIDKGKPWQNGYVEAQHRIDQERLYDTLRVESLEDGENALNAYQGISNLLPKPCLGMKSPTDLVG